MSKSEISTLHKLQNSCARLIYGKKKYESVSALLTKLHMLPIKQRIYFKILLLVFKFFKKKTPDYINECLEIADDLNLVIPRTLTPYGDRAFQNCAPRLWNSLPINIRCIDTIPTYKKKLKHYLFNNFQHFRADIDRYIT